MTDTATYTYVQHERTTAHESGTLSGPVKVRDQRRIHHPNPIVRFNARFGLLVTVIVGTMWCAYLFTLLALVSAPTAFRSGNKLIIVAWIAQTFLQLVLLPIIIVGQNVQAAAADARAEATYDDAAAVLEEAKQIQAHLLAQDDKITEILGAVGH